MGVNGNLLTVPAIHAVLNWVILAKLGFRLVGAAIVSNVSWCLLDVAQFVCLYFSCFEESWEGFSWLAIRDLGVFAKLSLTSALPSWEYVPRCLSVYCWRQLAPLYLLFRQSGRMSFF